MNTKKKTIFIIIIILVLVFAFIFLRKDKDANILDNNMSQDIDHTQKERKPLGDSLDLSEIEI
ncbi:MAG: regulatory protein YycI of two-component signal transduction system YycFG [Candidatus Paceibacteria bacterium]|jgi:regulatory protein YycI of two-component signal transduction system YycFG